MAHIFFHFWLWDDFVLPVWTFDINIFSSTYFICVIYVKYNYFVPARIVFVNILVAHIFLNSWLWDDFLVPVWTLDINIFTNTYFICVIYVKYNYSVPTRTVFSIILLAHIFLHFWLQDNYLVLVWTST